MFNSCKKDTFFDDLKELPNGGNFGDSDEETDLEISYDCSKFDDFKLFFQKADKKWALEIGVTNKTNIFFISIEDYGKPQSSGKTQKFERKFYYSENSSDFLANIGFLKQIPYNLGENDIAKTKKKIQSSKQGVEIGEDSEMVSIPF